MVEHLGRVVGAAKLLTDFPIAQPAFEPERHNFALALRKASDGVPQFPVKEPLLRPLTGILQFPPGLDCRAFGVPTLTRPALMIECSVAGDPEKPGGWRATARFVAWVGAKRSSKDIRCDIIRVGRVSQFGPQKAPDTREKLAIDLIEWRANGHHVQ